MKLRPLALVFAALFSALLLMCDSSTTSTGGLMLVLVNDGTLAVNRLRLEVRRGSDNVELYNRELRIPEDAPLPNSLAIAGNGDPAATAIISVVAFRVDGENRTALDRRDHIVAQIPSDHVVTFRIVLSAACSAHVKAASGESDCVTGTTCLVETGNCGANNVDASRLPPFTPGDEAEPVPQYRRPDASSLVASTDAASDALSDAGNDEDSGETGCGPGQKKCGAACVNIDDPQYGCVANGCSPCGNAGSFVCASGACTSAPCAAGSKRCNGECVRIDNPIYGCTATSCDTTPCPAASGATLKCNGSACEIGTCGGTTKKCGLACVSTNDATRGCADPTCTACPLVPFGANTCGASGQCVLGCQIGYKMCGGVCVPTDSAQYGCAAAACTACSTSGGNGTAGCSAGGTCTLTCTSGFKLCNGSCVAIDNPLFGCGATTCDASSCPSGGTTTCVGGQCVIGSCAPGTKKCSGACVTLDSTNGCADTARCSPCDPGQQCFGSPSICQCVAEPIATTCAGVECGSRINNCGATVNCPASCTSPPAATCQSPTTLRTYNATGTCSGSSCSYGFTDTTCTNQACVGSACTGVCTPGATQCTGTAVQTCSTSGTWTTTTDLTAPKWTATYGTAGAESTPFPSSLTATADGNYIIVGATASTATTGYAAKFGPTGTKLWSVGSLGTNLYGALGLSTGSTVVCGSSASGVASCGAGRWCGYCARLSSAGAIEWQKSVVSSNNDFNWFSGIAPNASTGFITAGYTTLTDIWLDIELRSFDAAGTQGSINRTFVKTKADALWQLRRAADGSYWGAGFVNQWDTCERPYLGHYDGTTGAIKGEVLFGPCNNELGASAVTKESSSYSVVPLADGSVVVAGGEWNAAGASGFVIKYSNVDTTPTQVWKKLFRSGTVGDTAFHAAELLPDGGFLLAGVVYPTSQDDPAKKGDIYVVRTDSLGNKIWDRTYGGAGADEGSAILRANDGTYLIGGFSGSFGGAGGTDLYVMDLPAVCP